MANEVFISYSRKDFAKVREIKAILDYELGIECWMDLDGIESGEQFKKVIITAINRHDTVLFMKTSNSMDSEFAMKELTFAKNKKKRIVLVDLDHTPMIDDFLFDYGDKDNIDWYDQLQRDKLIKDLQSWCGGSEPTILYPIKVGDLYGLADEDQNVVVKGTWLSIGHFHDGLAFVQSTDRKYGLVNHFGQIVVTYQWIRVDCFCEGIARVQGEDKKYGFVNNKGEIISPCIWDSAEHFSEGLACVTSTKENGYINDKGKMMIKYNEGNITSFSEGLACVSDKNGKWGYIDKNGVVVIPFQWEKACSFSKGLARVMNKDLYGYINKYGEYEIPIEWNDTELIPVQDPETNLWGYVNSKGEVKIPFEWISARPFSEGLARIEKNGVYGFIDRSGALVIPRRFIEAGDFKDGYAEIKDCVETRCSYVDKDGKLI